SCMRGCRLYGMIFLAHDPIVARTETASLCAKSCTSGGSSDAKTEACAAGCAQQDHVFRQHHLDGHSAKLAVLIGLARPPIVHSPSPRHWRLFDRAWPMQQQAAVGSVWLHAVRIHIRPMPAGPDGRPRYLVELAERAIPLRLVRLTGGGPRQVAVQADSHRRSPFASYWFDHPHSSILRYRHLSHRTRVALRWAACGILIASLIGLLCLCCSLARSTNQRQIRVLRSAIVKRQPPPSIQSGDILIGKKQQLLLPEKPADTI
ncbi:hypothetical protein BOX15_Mlig019913g1, partial [Macrostomum lignano]